MKAENRIKTQLWVFKSFAFPATAPGRALAWKRQSCPSFGVTRTLLPHGLSPQEQGWDTDMGKTPSAPILLPQQGAGRSEKGLQQRAGQGAEEPRREARCGQPPLHSRGCGYTDLLKKTAGNSLHPRPKKNNFIFLYIRERVFTLKSQQGPTGLCTTPGAATPWDQHRDPSLGVQPPPRRSGTQPGPWSAK